MARRGRGEGSVYFEHRPGTEHKPGSVNDPDNVHHRGCTGKWRGEVVVRAGGKRTRRRVTARTKTEIYNRLKDLKDELGQGIRTSANYTVDDAADDWLDGPMADRAAKTVATLRELLDPLLEILGDTVLRDLTADDVSNGLKKISTTRSTRTVRDTRGALVRAIKYAQSRDMVGRNVAALVKPPPGKSPGRPSKALTVQQALAVLKAARGDRLHAYVVLSLLTGIRTEEARALTWQHVDLDGDPPHIDVFRSVRAGGDVKTRTSRRTLALPQRAVDALQAHKEAQDKERAENEEVGLPWADSDLVFTTQLGGPLDAANVRRSFRRICKEAGIGGQWSPRDLRHSFVSIMSDSGVPIERIADLVGHAGGSRVTEQVYRKQIRPVITEGAEVMDNVFRTRRVVRRPAQHAKRDHS